MRRLSRILAALAVAAPAVLAHSQTCATGWAHVIATQIQNIDRSDGITPNYVLTGTFTIVAKNANNQATNFSIPGGGIATLTPRTRVVVSGALGQTLCVPRSDLSTPQVGYEITVRDTSPLGGNAEIIHLTGVDINAAEWSFDNYLITTPQPWKMFAGLAPIPSGTGFLHDSNGMLDGAARAIDLSSADVVGLLPLNKIAGGAIGVGNGSGASYYQYVENGSATLAQEATLNVDTTTGLKVTDDPTNARTNLGVDASHFIPTKTTGSTCAWMGDGTCASTSSNTLDGVTYTGTCTSGAVLVATSSTAGTCRPLHPSDLVPDFAVSQLSCATGTYEIGQAPSGTVACNVSYAGGLPTSGSVTDTQNHTVPLVSPNFNSATMPTPTALTSAGSVCYSVSVSNPAGSISNGACSGWYPMTYAGAVTGAITGGTTTASVSSGVLSIAGLTGSIVGAGLNNQASYTVSMSNQNGVIVAQGCGHTFYQDSGHVTQIVMQTPVAVTITNAYNVAVPGYCAYVTTNPLNLSNLSFYIN